MLVFKNRIPRHGKALRKMAKFLEDRYPVKPKIEVYCYDIPVVSNELLDDYDQEEWCKENEACFGVYIPTFGHILIATGSIDATLCQTIFAHEYRHVLQHLNTQPFLEQQADSFAIHCMLHLQAPESCTS